MPEPHPVAYSRSGFGGPFAFMANPHYIVDHVRAEGDYTPAPLARASGSASPPRARTARAVSSPVTRETASPGWAGTSAARAAFRTRRQRLAGLLSVQRGPVGDHTIAPLEIHRLCAQPETPPLVFQGSRFRELATT
ncbi:hypothetical protein ABZ848_48945 [Streptomyces sp. NPDC047081]|uniref:hypothetical protein n=1 Tax=Streptomyces sp. NPDC047081 TaxID=3154706 RepID=UPI003402A6DE